MKICACKAKEMISILLQIKLNMYVIVLSCINVAQKIQFKKRSSIVLGKRKKSPSPEQ